MNYQSAITPHIIIADQPTQADLQELKGQGYAGLVNLRKEGEPEQPIGPTVEGQVASNLGLDYLHIGVGGVPPSPEEIKAFKEFLDKHREEKVLVHCRKGSRASALVLVYLAQNHGWSPDEAFERGPKIGLTVDGGLKMLVNSVLARA